MPTRKNLVEKGPCLVYLVGVLLAFFLFAGKLLKYVSFDVKIRFKELNCIPLLVSYFPITYRSEILCLLTALDPGSL
jgi:hypothetical protein